MIKLKRKDKERLGYPDTMFYKTERIEIKVNSNYFPSPSEWEMARWAIKCGVDLQRIQLFTNKWRSYNGKFRKVRTDQKDLQ